MIYLYVQPVLHHRIFLNSFATFRHQMGNRLQRCSLYTDPYFSQEKMVGKFLQFAELKDKEIVW